MLCSECVDTKLHSLMLYYKVQLWDNLDQTLSRIMAVLTLLSLHNFTAFTAQFVLKQDKTVPETR